MSRWFNTAGPCRTDRNYMLPALRRLPEVRRLIEQGDSFVIYAPRPVGKTTALLSLARELTAEGRYAALHFSCEEGQAYGDNFGAAQRAIVREMGQCAELELPAELRPPPLAYEGEEGLLWARLSTWAQACPRPLVLIFDEIDALRGQSLLSVLRQLRAGYPSRPQGFPASVILCGLRDVRDYKVKMDEREHQGTASPFNILVRSLTVRDFTAEEVEELYQQHTADTGQRFEPEAQVRAWELTQGQPWLVNSLAKVAVEELVTDPAQPVRREHIEQVKVLLIERQETHLDSLAERLREPRVRAVLEPMLAGRTLGDVPEDDRRFAVDLGLVRRGAGGTLEVANPIYREIIVRVLTSGTRDTLPPLQPTWRRADGRLDMERLREAFLAFWRQHGEVLQGSTPYHEVAPQLVLMAFLHRVVNGGGTMEREYAIGRGRMDLCVRQGPDTLAMELKVWRDKEVDPQAEGLVQLDRYLEGLGQDTGWLVVFDQRGGQPPLAERTRAEQATTPKGRSITVIRA